jgi:hypothetical protein
MKRAFGLRYTDSVSVGGDATVDMEIGKQTNMIGFGINNNVMNVRAKPGRVAVVVPAKKTLMKTKKAYIHIVMSNDGLDVWKSSKKYIAKKAPYLGELSLTDSEINDISKCGQIISDEIADKIADRFFDTL